MAKAEKKPFLSLGKKDEIMTKDEFIAQMTADDVPENVYNELEKEFYSSFEFYRLPGGAPEEVGFAKYVPYINLALVILLLLKSFIK